MVDGHEKNIEKAQKASEKASDEEIRMWAANKLVALTKHRDHAKNLKTKVDSKK